MRTYELMIIFDRDSEEGSRDSVLKNLETNIGDLGGTITHTDVWGMRNFAYSIDDKNEGYYIVMEFTAQGELTEIDRAFRLSEDVVRYKILHLPISEVDKRAEKRAKPSEESAATTDGDINGDINENINIDVVDSLSQVEESVPVSANPVEVHRADANQAEKS